MYRKTINKNKCGCVVRYTLIFNDPVVVKTCKKHSKAVEAYQKGK